ncbi:MAG: phosphoribosylamine--glycine ligase [Spirochaetaceae bacterium]|nr:MAG: phosphoribosylamine--glycine ligase [Spirochaetaceae bacterium]
MARVLVVGSGGREHTLTTFLEQSAEVDAVYTAPGNAGTPGNVPIDVMGEGGFGELMRFAAKQHIDLTVVGPEAPLCAGLVDAFQREGLAIFGPSRAAAALEADKAYARDFMRRHGIPSPEFQVFAELSAARRYVDGLPVGPVVVKAAGLAAGKGAIVCENRKQAEEALERMMGQRIFGAAGDTVVIEEYMEGEEASILALCDGEKALYLPSSQDHKRVLDGDQGPNTGGMGAYAPAPVVTLDVQDIVDRRIVQPTLAGLAAVGAPYRGCLYVGLMIRDGQPRVVEYNCRFGDPEIQAVLPLLRSDFFSLLRAGASGDLGSLEARCAEGAACCVVMASGGYPDKYEKGKEIRGLEVAESLEGVYVFHAGTRRDEQGRVFTSGGRVLGVTGTGATIRQAIEAAYRGVEKIEFEACQFRRDIGYRALRSGAI